MSRSSYYKQIPGLNFVINDEVLNKKVYDFQTFLTELSDNSKLMVITSIELIRLFTYNTCSIKKNEILKEGISIPDNDYINDRSYLMYALLNFPSISKEKQVNIISIILGKKKQQSAFKGGLNIYKAMGTVLLPLLLLINPTAATPESKIQVSKGIKQLKQGVAGVHLSDAKLKTALAGSNISLVDAKEVLDDIRNGKFNDATDKLEDLALASIGTIHGDNFDTFITSTFEDGQQKITIQLSPPDRSPLLFQINRKELNDFVKGRLDLVVRSAIANKTNAKTAFLYASEVVLNLMDGNFFIDTSPDFLKEGHDLVNKIKKLNSDRINAIKEAIKIGPGSVVNVISGASNIVRGGWVEADEYSQGLLKVATGTAVYKYSISALTAAISGTVTIGKAAVGYSIQGAELVGQAIQKLGPQIGPGILGAIITVLEPMSFIAGSQAGGGKLIGGTNVKESLAQLIYMLLIIGRMNVLSMIESANKKYNYNLSYFNEFFLFFHKNIDVFRNLDNPDYQNKLNELNDIYNHISFLPDAFLELPNTNGIANLLELLELDPEDKSQLESDANKLHENIDGLIVKKSGGRKIKGKKTRNQKKINSAYRKTRRY
jgi:hypothetical protein